jgi:hypothetical protein
MRGLCLIPPVITLREWGFFLSKNTTSWNHPYQNKKIEDDSVETQQKQHPKADVKKHPQADYNDLQKPQENHTFHEKP